MKDMHFMLGAQRWTVRVVPADQWAAGEAGECKPLECLIRIREANKDVMRDTLLHELLHAVLALVGTGLDTDDEERIVAGITPILDMTLDWKIRGLK